MKTKQNNRTVAYYFIIAAVETFILSGCNELVSYNVNGTLDIQNIDCDGVIPQQVKVQAQLFKGNDLVGKAGIFNSNGPFNMTIDWPKHLGQPAAWRVTTVTRVDGTNLCELEDMICPESKKCIDMATKVRQAPINNPIHWRVRCTCK
jgi:hypothetical protein